MNNFPQETGTSLLKSYFPELLPEQIKQFEALDKLYTLWNGRLNLISRRDLPFLYTRHVLHSLAIAKVINWLPGTKILDVGTGGGFPTIPLAIFFPQVSFHAIDSTGKKITAVKAIVEELGLSNVQVTQIRAEELVGQYDFILGRAVTDLKTFHGWVKDKVKSTSKHSLKNGILYLRGGDHTEALNPFKQKIHLFPVKDYFKLPYFETKQLLHLSC